MWEYKSSGKFEFVKSERGSYIPLFKGVEISVRQHQRVSVDFGGLSSPEGGVPPYERLDRNTLSSQKCTEEDRLTLT